MRQETRTVRISGERLAELWRGSLMSKESFAQASGMKRSGVFRLMRPGVHGMFTDNFRRMAQVLNTTPAELRRRIGLIDPGGADESGSLNGVSGDVEPLDAVKSFHSISAGTRCERLAIEGGLVQVPPKSCDFCVRVQGESMTPEYPDNALVLCRAVEGQAFVYEKDYIIWFTDDECYFSRVFASEDDRDLLVLRKLNADRTRFPDRTAHRRDIRRIARCVGVFVLTE